MRLNKVKDSLGKRVSSATSKVGSKTKPKLVIGLDVGTENVKASIAEVRGDNLIVIGAGTASQGPADMQAGAVSDIQEVRANCEKALSEAETQAGTQASAVVVGIAGELVKGVTETINFERSDPEAPLTFEEIDSLVKKVQKEAHTQALKEIQLERGPRNYELKLVNSALIAIEVDGYPVSNPIEFQGRDITIQMYCAFAPLVHIGALERIVSELSMDLIAVAAEPFAVARSMVGNQQDSSQNAILIDVGGGTTDIAVLQEGRLEGTRMFAIGGRSFTKSIMRKQNCSFEEAEKTKLALSVSAPSTHDNDVIEALEDVADVWLQGVELALSEFDWLDYLPERILLCGGGSSLELVQEKLNSNDWQKDLKFSKKPNVTLLSPDKIVGMQDKSSKISNHKMITVMGLVRVAADTISLSEEDSSPIKHRFSKALEN